MPSNTTTPPSPPPPAAATAASAASNRSQNLAMASLSPYGLYIGKSGQGPFYSNSVPTPVLSNKPCAAEGSKGQDTQASAAALLLDLRVELAAAELAGVEVALPALGSLAVDEHACGGGRRLMPDVPLQDTLFVQARNANWRGGTCVLPLEVAEDEEKREEEEEESHVVRRGNLVKKRSGVA